MPRCLCGEPGSHSYFDEGRTSAGGRTTGAAPSFRQWRTGEPHTAGCRLLFAHSLDGTDASLRPVRRSYVVATSTSFVISTRLFSASRAWRLPRAHAPRGLTPPAPAPAHPHVLRPSNATRASGLCAGAGVQLMIIDRASVCLRCFLCGSRAGTRSRCGPHRASAAPLTSLKSSVNSLSIVFDPAKTTSLRRARREFKEGWALRWARALEGRMNRR